MDQKLEPFKGLKLTDEKANVSKKLQLYTTDSPRQGNVVKSLRNV